MSCFREVSCIMNEALLTLLIVHDIVHLNESLRRPGSLNSIFVPNI